jgi:cbb3-type cytochrome c oxidase subunit III
MKKRITTVWVLSVALLIGLTGCFAPRAGDPNPSFDGARLYRENCASCHGQSGAGNGPMLPHLSSPPSDLRILSARNNGVFPRMEVTRQIDGRDMSAVHGSSEMPVWGWKFSHADNDKRDPVQQTRARITALVDHLETMQQ